MLNFLSFFTFNSRITSSWEEYFSAPEITPSIKGIHQNGQYNKTISGNFYVSHVTFSCVIATEGQGGAIYIDAATKLLVESSIFYHCCANGEGGSIYLKNKESQSVLKMICSVNSTSLEYSQHFCYIEVGNNNDTKNYIDRSSIAKLSIYVESGPHFHVHGGNIRLKYGNSLLRHDNISYNRFQREVGTFCDRSLKVHILYSSFENNTAAESDGVIWFYLTNKDNLMETCNVIRNFGKSTGTIRVQTAQLKIKNSCILENKGNVVFDLWNEGDAILFYNCSVDSFKNIGDYHAIIRVVSEHKDWIRSTNNLYFQQNTKCLDSFEIMDETFASKLKATQNRKYERRLYSFIHIFM